VLEIKKQTLETQKPKIKDMHTHEKLGNWLGN
jgi:hypothetical protein